MMRSLSIPLGTFTADKLGSLEVERLTGLTQVQIRDWRRRGLLERGAGVRSYDAFDIAEIAVRRALSQLGLPLADTAEPAKRFAAGLVAEICSRTAWAEAHREEIAAQLHALLGSPAPLVLVRQGADEVAEVFGLDADTLAHELSSHRLGPVWGVLDLSMIAGLIVSRSKSPLVTFTIDPTGGSR